MTQRSGLAVFQCVIWTTLLCAVLAWGQIYRWTDRWGQVHLTDNPSRIPPEYGTNATVYGASPPAAPAAPTTPGDEAGKAPEPASASPSQPQALAEPRDRLGRGPEYWRGLAQHWSTELQQHMAERDRLKLLHDYTQNLANSTRDVWDRGRLAAEIRRLEDALTAIDQRIVRAQTMLQTTLPLEAVQLGADPAWLTELTPPTR